MDNPEKRATYGTQDEEKHNTTQRNGQHTVHKTKKNITQHRETGNIRYTRRRKTQHNIEVTYYVFFEKPSWDKLQVEILESQIFKGPCEQVLQKA